MYRFALFVLIVLSLAVNTYAQPAKLILDSQTHQPLPKATIFDKNGRVVGIASQRGEVPYISDESYPLSVRYIGYETAIVKTPNSFPVLMRESVSDLPEIVVQSRKNQILHLLGYVREYSTVTTYSDTVFMFREKLVDFMLPGKGVRKFNGWSHPRVMASKSYYNFKNINCVDSVSDYFPEHFSWCDWVGIQNNIPLPQGLRNNDFALDTVKGKYSPAVIWKRSEDRVDLDIDILADRANYKYVNALAGYLDADMDFRRLNIHYLFDNVADTVADAKNLSAYSFNIESSGRGRNLSRLLLPPGQPYVETYAEVYIIDSEYISRKEATEWQQRQFNDDLSQFELPADIPELSPSIVELIDRVKNSNPDQARLFMQPDKRLGREQKRMTLLKRLKGMLGIYSQKVIYHKPGSRSGNK